MSPRAFRWFLAAVTLLGLLLRVVHLDATAGFDETVNLRRFIQGGPAAIFAPYSGYGSTNNHLLNSILSWPAAAVFGVELWALRLPSLLLGVAAVPLFGLAGRELLGQRRAGALAALFAALAPILISYSPACRGYAALVFFIVLATWLLVRALAGASRPALLGTFLALVAAGWSHMSGLIFVGSAGAAAALLLAASFLRPGILPGRRRDAVRATVAVLAAGIVLGGWYSRKSRIVQDVTSKVVTGEFVDPSLAGLRSVQRPPGLLRWMNLLGENLYGTDGIWIVPAGLASIVGIFFVLRRDPGRGLVLTTLAVFPFVALRAGDLTPSPRHVLFVLPALLWLAAAAVAGLGERVAARSPHGSRGLWTWCFGALFLSLSAPDLVANLSGPGSSFMGVVWDVAGAARFVAERAAPDDVVVHYPRPPQRTHQWEWAFHPTWEFHEQNGIARRLSIPSPGSPTRRIWWVSPYFPAQHFDLLPEGFRPTIEAERVGCWVYSQEFEVTGTERVPLPPIAPAETLGDWSWHHPVGRAFWEAAPEVGRLSITSGEESSVADVVSPALAVEPGTIVDAEVRVWAERGGTLRPLGRLDLTFFGAGREPIVSVGREALTWLERDPGPEGSLIRLCAVVPRAARTLELSVGLADGNVDGTRVRFAQPKLSVVRIR